MSSDINEEILEREEQQARRENVRTCYKNKKMEYAVSMADQKIKLLGLMAEFLGLLAILMHFPGICGLVSRL